MVNYFFKALSTCAHYLLHLSDFCDPDPTGLETLFYLYGYWKHFSFNAYFGYLPITYIHILCHAFDSYGCADNSISSLPNRALSISPSVSLSINTINNYVSCNQTLQSLGGSKHIYNTLQRMSYSMWEMLMLIICLLAVPAAVYIV